MAVTIQGVAAGSPAARAKMAAGDQLISINGSEIFDVLDYRFYMVAEHLDICARRSGEAYRATVEKEEYEELGLSFSTYLIDEQRHCKNKCVFCFIDQLPQGLRESLYFKDDDSRMSFLFGNYITLTNLPQWDLERIVKMHISPVNISVHTTNPELRVKMMANPKAGEVLSVLPRLAQAGIRLNTQLVLCPGLNDGAELERSLRDLTALAPQVQSVAVVPVGLTAHREGLADLRGFSKAEAEAVIDLVGEFGEKMLKKHGQRICYAADEFYLLAHREIPNAAFYEDFAQLENGVGLLALLEDEFFAALKDEPARPLTRRVAIATGVAAQPYLCKLAKAAMEHFPGLNIEVVAIKNNFFGHSITVAGLVTGEDLIAQLAGKGLGDALLFPAVMLRHERDVFLDDTSVGDVEKRLGVPATPVENDGYELLRAVLGER